MILMIILISVDILRRTTNAFCFADWWRIGVPVSSWFSIDGGGSFWFA